ncbi:MAG: DUF4360 domain-containing protein [Oligoflexus sp.]
MKRFTLNILAGLIISSTLGMAAMAQTTPNPNEIYIKRITYAGPGCRAGSVVGNISLDAKAFTLVFNEFIAEIGQNVAQGKNKTSCRVTLDIQIPNGWSYTLFDTTFRGYTYLDPGVQASINSGYYFQASPNRVARFNHQFNGYFDDNFSITNSIGIHEVVWSRCGRQRALNIDTNVELSNSGTSNSGLFTVDSLDGEFKQIFGIRWQRC